MMASFLLLILFLNFLRRYPRGDQTKDFPGDAQNDEFESLELADGEEEESLRERNEFDILDRRCAVNIS